MIVGPTGGGKTVVLDTLKAARLKAEGVVVKYYVINPKAQPLNELYGVMDPVTRDWTDGPYLGVPRCLHAIDAIRLEESRSWVVCFPILRLIATLRAGVLSRLFRELNEPLPKAKEGKEMRWIIYDGDVDAVWVENMNSVSDSAWFPSISQLEVWEDGVNMTPSTWPCERLRAS